MEQLYGPLHPSATAPSRHPATLPKRWAIDGQMSHPYRGKLCPGHHRARSLRPTLWPCRCWRSQWGREPTVTLTSANLPEPPDSSGFPIAAALRDEAWLPSAWGARGACLGKPVCGCSRATLAPTCGCWEGRGSPRLGKPRGRGRPSLQAPRPGLGQPCYSRP